MREKELKPFIAMHKSIVQVIFIVLDLLYKDTNGHILNIDFPQSQYTYGDFSSMKEYYKLFLHSKNLNRPGSVFCDLGSGVGKASLTVAAVFPVTRSIGIEIVDNQHHLALGAKYLFEKTIAPRLNRAVELDFIHGDLEKHIRLWNKSDVIYVNCVTWRNQMLKRLISVLDRLKEGTEVFSSKKLNVNKMNLVKEIQCKSSWGKNTVFFYKMRRRTRNIV